MAAYLCLHISQGNFLFPNLHCYTASVTDSFTKGRNATPIYTDNLGTCSYRKKRKILIGTHYFVYVQFDYARKDIVNKMFSRIIVKFVGFILAVFPYTLLLLRILKNGWNNVFKVIPRNKPPKALSDPSLGRHGFITTEDGISLIRFQF